MRTSNGNHTLGPCPSTEPPVSPLVLDTPNPPKEQDPLVLRLQGWQDTRLVLEPRGIPRSQNRVTSASQSLKRDFWATARDGLSRRHSPPNCSVCSCCLPALPDSARPRPAEHGPSGRSLARAGVIHAPPAGPCWLAPQKCKTFLAGPPAGLAAAGGEQAVCSLVLTRRGAVRRERV